MVINGQEPEQCQSLKDPGGRATSLSVEDLWTTGTIDGEIIGDCKEEKGSIMLPKIRC